MSDTHEIIKGPHPLAPGEYFIRCPYNKNHIITNKRELTHVVKCRKNYMEHCSRNNLEIDMGTCKFNFSHQVPRLELEGHERRCNDQYPLAKFVDYETSGVGLKQKNEIRARNKLTAAEMEKARQQLEKLNPRGDDDNNWDDDEDVNGQEKKGYDPADHLRKGFYLHMPKLLTKSQKREFRTEQRKKFAAAPQKKNLDRQRKSLGSVESDQDEDVNDEGDFFFDAPDVPPTSDPNDMQRGPLTLDHYEESDIDDDQFVGCLDTPGPSFNSESSDFLSSD